MLASWMLAVPAALVAGDAATLFIVNEPWVRVASDKRSAEVYMQLTSTDGATVVGVGSSEGAKIEINAPGARPTPANEIRLPAGELVLLAPKGYRLVVSGLRRKLKLGDRVLLVLEIEGADGTRSEIPVDAEVRLRSPTDDHKRAHHR